MLKTNMNRSRSPGTLLLCCCLLLVAWPESVTAFAPAVATYRHHHHHHHDYQATIKSAIVSNSFPGATIARSASTLPQQQEKEVNKEQNAVAEAISSSTDSITTAAATTTTTSLSISNTKSWMDDGFVFGLDGSGLERPQGRVASLVVEGDSLETQPNQIAMVTLTFLAHAWFATHAWQGMLTVNDGNVLWTSLQAFLLTLASWVLADFGSGVLHWSVDNYGNGRTPIMGGIIAAFQGHHSAPWTIAQRGFCNNVYKLCIPFGPLPMAIISVVAGPFTTFFFTLFCVFEIMSQEFHKWSHQLKSEVPGWVNWLQRMGLTIARKPHAQHHLAPFEGNYCIISGICNKLLDQSGFFRRLEHWIYQWNGVESNAWKLDAALRERTLRGEYGLVLTPKK